MLKNHFCDICVSFVFQEFQNWNPITEATHLYRKHNVTSLLRHSLLINMPFTNGDKLWIKFLHQEKGWGAKRICKEFSYKNWQSVLLEIFCARLTQ